MLTLTGCPGAAEGGLSQGAHTPARCPLRASVGHARLGAHLCSTKTSAASRLKERTAPLLKPQKKVGCVGWKATAHGASSGDAKSYSWGGRQEPHEGGQWDPESQSPQGV